VVIPPVAFAVRGSAQTTAQQYLQSLRLITTLMLLTSVLHVVHANVSPRLLSLFVLLLACYSWSQMKKIMSAITTLKEHVLDLWLLGSLAPMYLRQMPAGNPDNWRRFKESRQGLISNSF
jgi:hypothetical protein